MSDKKRNAAKSSDAKAAASIESRVRKLARKARLIPKAGSKSSRLPLPIKLEPDLAIRERRLMHKAMRYFEARFRAGHPVFHVTWCPVEFRVPQGTLDPSIVKKLRDLASRRARNIPTAKGRRLIGAVDVSYNADPGEPTGGLYCVHGHMVSTTGDLTDKRSQRSLKVAFRDVHAAKAGLKIKPTQVKKVRDEAHLRQVIAYASGCLALVDHNPQQNRHRRSRVVSADSKFSSDEMLSDELQAEVTRLFAEVGPAGFWILSGFRRRGRNIKPDPPFTGQERADLKAFRQYRRVVRKQVEANPTSFSAIYERKRLF